MENDHAHRPTRLLSFKNAATPRPLQMILLVTDTSGKNGTVALARAGEPDRDEIDVIEVVPLAGGMFSAQLVPQIAALLQKHDFSKADIDGFVVVSGPGSFTGLRVGLAAIKALAEILQKPIAPVSLLQLVAAVSRAQGRVVAVLDGGRGEVFFGAYVIAGESVQALREELLSKAVFLSAARESTVATPDPALAAAARDAGLSVVTVDAPNAAMIARFGWKKLQAGQTVSPEQLEGNYMRRSDAEMFVKKSF
jgi:tRNA threonylcarbamoyladenosine biosynthesis protein TsaB